MDRVILCVWVSLVGSLAAGSAAGQVTKRVSLANGWEEGDHGVGVAFPSISADGRFVAFESIATNLVTGDTNWASDVFVRDCYYGTTERVSVATSGVQGNQFSGSPSISADGRFVAFRSNATNLVSGDTNGWTDIFVHDRLSGTTERVSVATGGGQGNDVSEYPSISADGRFVAFHSNATNFVSGDANGVPDVFVYDRQSGTTELVSVATGGIPGNGFSEYPSISADGRFVAFYSDASDLVAGDTNADLDVFVRDRQSGTTERVSVATGGAQGNGGSYYPSISADGRYISYTSSASNLVSGDTNGGRDVFVYDRQRGTTELVSVATGGAQGDNDSDRSSISADGRFVAFQSYASTLVAGDANGFLDVFLRDRQSGTTELVSVTTGGIQGNYESSYPSISANGRLVAFLSTATNLVSGDTNGARDAFFRDRDATGFTSLCDPGANGVIACPCSNPPSASGRGCDNSAATGGAILSASGVAYLYTDSLVFTSAGETPTALSIFLQGSTDFASGATYGQGVRCVGGSLKRLFDKVAVGGSASAPDYAAGDPTVSARSAARGDVIHAGQSRWYLVYYRDPSVLGGCPASSTFNSTQTGRIDWSL